MATRRVRTRSAPWSTVTVRALRSALMCQRVRRTTKVRRETRTHARRPFGTRKVGTAAHAPRRRVTERMSRRP